MELLEVIVSASRSWKMEADRLNGQITLPSNSSGLVALSKGKTKPSME